MKEKIKKLNELLHSKTILKIIKNHLSNSFRMCLNRNVVEEIRKYISNCINSFFFFEISENDLEKIYNNFEYFLIEKIKSSIQTTDKYEIYEILYKKRIENYLYLHGTSYNLNKQYNIKKLYSHLKIINDVYESYGIYKCFESKMKEKESFWITNAIKSSVFYAYQSPEFLARFASRSDYYKQDPFLYDKLAYYRKDYRACRKNILIEMQEFNFIDSHKKIVLKSFKKLWNLVLSSYSKPVLYMIDYTFDDKLQKLDIDEVKKMSLVEIYQSLFIKKNYSLDKKDINFKPYKIELPQIYKYLKKENVKFDRKYIIINNKKCYPDFYTLSHVFPKPVYFFDISETKNFLSVSSVLENNNESILVDLLMNYYPNSERAKAFMGTLEKKYNITELTEIYKKRTERLVNKLKRCKDFKEKANLMLELAEGDGLRYICLLHYKCLFKDSNQAFMYNYSKLLGKETYKNPKRLDKQLKIYEILLKNPQKILDLDYPFNKIKGNLIEI